jgi:hypothetical protein
MEVMSPLYWDSSFFPPFFGFQWQSMPIGEPVMFCAYKFLHRGMIEGWSWCNFVISVKVAFLRKFLGVIDDSTL